MYRSTIYHSTLSDQSALEISSRIRVRLTSCSILAFLRRIRKMSNLSSVNVTDVNLVLKERAHKIKMKYSMHQYSNSYAYFRQLPNMQRVQSSWQHYNKEYCIQTALRTAINGCMSTVSIRTNGKLNLYWLLWINNTEYHLQQHRTTLRQK